MMTFVSNQFYIDLVEETLEVGLIWNDNQLFQLCLIDLRNANIKTFKNLQAYIDLPMDHMGNIVWIIFETLFGRSQKVDIDFFPKLKMYFSHVMTTLGRDKYCENFPDEIDELVDFIHLTMVLSEDKSSDDFLKKYLNRVD